MAPAVLVVYDNKLTIGKGFKKIKLAFDQEGGSQCQNQLVNFIFFYFSTKQ